MFTCKINDSVNGIDVRVYELNDSDPVDFAILQAYLTKKIKTMKIHRDFELYDVFNVPTLHEPYVERINAEIQRINSPTHNRLKWFDVRRSRVTEFMSLFLLEDQMQCRFFDEADKRINLEPYEADKHVGGVDVAGIQDSGEELKFVICEVKASKEKKIPCSSADHLLSDIQKAYSDEKRILREIEYYYQKLGAALSGEEVVKILKFLIGLLMVESSKQALLENIIFIPFFIRSNPDIVRYKNLNDFRNFRIKDFTGADLTGIIWSVNFDIDQFANELYNKALNNGQKKS